MHGTPPPLYIKYFSTDLRKSQERSEQKCGGGGGGGSRTPHSPRGDATGSNTSACHIAILQFPEEMIRSDARVIRRCSCGFLKIYFCREQTLQAA